jgi:hypothetical protein
MSRQLTAPFARTATTRPDVLLRLFHGTNTGKLVLALDGD